MYGKVSCFLNLKSKNSILRLFFVLSRTGKVKSLFLGTAEMTVPDVDDMPDEESYTSYPVRALYS